MAHRETNGQLPSAYDVFDASFSAVIAVDPDHVIDYVNVRACQMFDVGPDSLLGHRLEDLVQTEDRPGVTRLLALARDAAKMGRETGPPVHSCTARRSDGALFPVDVTVSPLRRGQAPWLVSTFRDATNRVVTERRTQALSRAYLTLARLNQVVVRAEDEVTLFADACRISVEQGGYLGAWVGVAEGDHVVPVAQSGPLRDYVSALDIVLDPEDARGRGPTAIALREGRSYFSADFARDAATAPWREAAARHGIGSSATMPLRRSGEVAAVITLYARQTQLFDDAVRRLLTSFRDNIDVALTGFDTARRLADVAQERTRLAERLVVAQEDERARIAADLHDDSVQSLAAVDIRLGMLLRRITRDRPLSPDELSDGLLQAKQTVNDVTRQLRDLLFTLDAGEDTDDLVEMIRSTASQVFLEGGIDVAIVAGTDPALPAASPLPAATRTQVHRIVKEAMVNVRRHAHARAVEVSLTARPGWLRLDVCDDGVGIEPEEPLSAAGHRGLRTMRDRASVLGGRCTIERIDPAAPTPYAHGTRVRLEIPLSAPRPPEGGEPVPAS